jgi:hypothetical protein
MKESHPPAKAEQARRTATTERMRSSIDGWEAEVVGAAMTRRLSCVWDVGGLAPLFHCHTQGGCILYKLSLVALARAVSACALAAGWRLVLQQVSAGAR